jgi:signal peptidase I
MKTLIIINTLLLIFILNPFNIFVYYVRNNIVQCLNIQEDSMAPALMKGDKILINRSIYRKSEPKRGDIVFFKTASHKLISRLIGLPKDTVEIRNGTLLVNAAVVKKGFPKENMTLKVPEDSYFVSKDNYLLPSDTRLTETISKRYLKGKVYKIYYPFHRSGPVR